VPRERQVLGLMAQGLSNPSIAAELHLSLSSIEKHVNAIFASLGLVAEPTTHRRVTAVLTYLRAVSAS
jgi:DNA-binding NarL/FixJ family response regulator